MKKKLDPVEAARLYDEGRSWNEVGRLIALLNQRRSPYQGEYVRRIVRLHDRREPEAR